MSVLHIALQDGFDDDHVLVRVNGREVFARHGVSTRRQIGLAESFEASLEDDVAQLEVGIPARRISGSWEIDAREYPFVGVSINEGRLSLRGSRQPFGYV